MVFSSIYQPIFFTKVYFYITQCVLHYTMCGTHDIHITYTKQITNVVVPPYICAFYDDLILGVQIHENLRMRFISVYNWVMYFCISLSWTNVFVELLWSILLLISQLIRDLGLLLVCISCLYFCICWTLIINTALNKPID